MRIFANVGRRNLSLRLVALDVLSFKTFVTRDNLERDDFAFVQGLESSAHDRRVMHEHILAGFLGNKAKPLFIIEPLNFTTCHTCCS